MEALIEFMITHGGADQINFTDSLVSKALSPQPDLPQGLSLPDREDVSWLFIEFVDLYGSIQEIEKAWDRHRKLFPHIIRPVSLRDFDNINSSTVGIRPSSFCPSNSNDNPGFGTNLPLEATNPKISNCAGDTAFESEEGNAILSTLEQLIIIEDAGKKCLQESELLLQHDTTDGGNIIQQVNPSSKNVRTADQSQDFNSLDVICTSTVKPLPMNPQINDALKTQTTSSKNMIADKPIRVCKKSENQDFNDNDYIVDFPETSKAHIQSDISSSAIDHVCPGHIHANVDNDYIEDLPETSKAHMQSVISSSAHDHVDPGHILANMGTFGRNTVLPTTKEDDMHLEKDGSRPDSYNVTKEAASCQVFSVRLKSDTSTMAYDSTHQERLDSSRSTFCSPLSTHMLNIQGYQQPVQKEQLQQCSQQTHNTFANCEVYQTGSFPFLELNYPQGFAPSYQQQEANQSVSNFQIQPYQHELQNNGQYGYLPNGQEYPPNLWHHYYQQQLYNFQLMQQSLQLQQQKQQSNCEPTVHPQWRQPQFQQPHEHEEKDLSGKMKQHHQKATEQQQHIQQSPQQQQSQQNQPHGQMLNMQKQKQQIDNHLHPFHQQQLLIQQQQQLLLQQQQYHQYLQQTWQEQQHLQNPHQLQIRPSDIQALSDKYLQGPCVASENSENVEVEKSSSASPSSQQLP